jgi:hypothetical protein
MAKPGTQQGSRAEAPLQPEAENRKGLKKAKMQQTILVPDLGGPVGHVELRPAQVGPALSKACSTTHELTASSFGGIACNLSQKHASMQLQHCISSKDRFAKM